MRGCKNIEGTASMLKYVIGVKNNLKKKKIQHRQVQSTTIQLVIPVQIQTGEYLVRPESCA